MLLARFRVLVPLQVGAAPTQGKIIRASSHLRNLLTGNIERSERREIVLV